MGEPEVIVLKQCEQLHISNIATTPAIITIVTFLWQGTWGRQRNGWFPEVKVSQKLQQQRYVCVFFKTGNIGLLTNKRWNESVFKMCLGQSSHLDGLYMIMDRWATAAMIELISNRIAATGEASVSVDSSITFKIKDRKWQSSRLLWRKFLMF